MINRIILTVIIFSTITYSQQYTINGKIENKITHQPLVYANIRVLQSTNGTAANKEGEYEKELLDCIFIQSCLGYVLQ